MTGLSPSSRKILFLSDVHLGGFSKKENDQIESDLLGMIDFCMENGINLYILGDLFDYWMEYPGKLPDIGHRLRDKLMRYNRELGPSTYITGNHDNWTDAYFKEIGFRVKNDYHTLELDDKKLLLLHGDGLLTAENEVRRPMMHRLLRNPAFVSLFKKILPPRAGLWLMKWYSRTNRWLNGWHTDPSVLDEWAEKMLRDSEIDVIICGHDHIPREKKFFFGTYLNLGTFYRHRTVVLYNNNALDLVFWDNKLRQFSNYYSSTHIDQP